MNLVRHLGIIGNDCRTHKGITDRLSIDDSVKRTLSRTLLCPVVLWRSYGCGEGLHLLMKVRDVAVDK